MIRQQCEGCPVVVEAADLPSFGDAFITHVRAAHPDWPFPDEAIRNYAEATQRLTTDTARRDRLGEVEVHPVAPDRLADWQDFFDHHAFAGNPAEAACYCLEPHLVAPGDTEPVSVQPWQDNRERMLGMLRNGQAYGYLAYADGHPAGWINASVRAECRLYRQGADADPGDPDVVSISCIGIAPPYRGHRLAGVLIDRVLADAAGRGARWVEAYPFRDAAALDLDHWRGHRSLYDERGFTVVRDRGRDSVLRRRC